MANPFRLLQLLHRFVLPKPPQKRHILPKTKMDTYNLSLYILPRPCSPLMPPSGQIVWSCQLKLTVVVAPQGSWVSTHWAPYWWTCDVCSPGSQPNYVLKTETLDWDLSVVLGALGLDINSKFPDVRVTGSDDDFSEGNRVTEEFVGKYTYKQ